MELGLSSPDLVAVRIPEPMPDAFAPFMQPLHGLDSASRVLLEQAHRRIEGYVHASGLLLAIAIKRSTRSDRLYQPLFEANVLKYLVRRVLRGSAFRFHVHMETFDGADVIGHYQAASLVSLIEGGAPTKAVDKLVKVTSPILSAQAVVDDLPLFPV